MSGNNYGNKKGGPIYAAKSRMRADRLLSEGSNPMEDLFVKHHNYHVRRRAMLLNLKSGAVQLPTDETELAKVLAELHIKRELVAAYLPAGA